MSILQPKPDSKKYSDLISQIQSGIIKVPKFQRDFVWSIEKTAQLLDSILKGYPIGTFILWETDERINDIKNIGNLEIPDTPDGQKVQYVLDGQQRITSLFAAYLGAKIQKINEKKVTDYSDIYVNLDGDMGETDDQIITSSPTGEHYISLSDILNFQERMIDIQERHPENFQKIHAYSRAFDTYDFSTVLLRKDDIDSAIEVFTRINTGGQTLTLFEIMSAKTYDETQAFDMQRKWEELEKELKEVGFDGISSTNVLSLLSLILSQTKECKRKTILKLNKQDIIETWDVAISALKDSIDYFRKTYRIPVSRLLPYDSLLVPFAYFFYYNKNSPSGDQRKLLEEFFWRASLSFRYSSATESKLAQDIKRINLILDNERPQYAEFNIQIHDAQDLIDTNFSAGNSLCKAILCLYAYHEPKNFDDNGRVILDNSWLKVASSKNYHHFFPKAYLRGEAIGNSNSLMNIVFVSDHLNKRKIGAKAPSDYIGDFADENSGIGKALESHLIGIDGFGIESDDYEVFLGERAKRVFDELQTRINLTNPEPSYEDVRELISGGESSSVEFKSTLRFDIRQGVVNKKLEYVIAKTIAAFLNSEGGSLLIGVDDDQNILGLTLDIDSLGKQNLDGFDLHLTGVINKYIGAVYSSHIDISYPELDGIQICLVRVSKSGKSVVTKFEGNEHFFIRNNSSSQPLSRSEQSEYEKGRA